MAIDTQAHQATGEIGKPRRRVEDNRLIRGAGRYPDDLAPPGWPVGRRRERPERHAVIRKRPKKRPTAAPGARAA